MIDCEPSDNVHPQHDESNSEKTLRGLLDNSSVMMGVVSFPADDDTFVHVYDNQATERFFGLGHGETVGRTGRELGAPLDVIAEWTARYRESQRNNSPVRFEHAVRVDSGEVWLSTVVAPMGQDAAGAALFSYVTENITSRKEAEERLRQSESRWRFLTRLSDALHAKGDPVEIAHEACALVLRQLELSRCTYTTVDQSRDLAIVRAESARTPPNLLGEHQLSRYGAELWSRSASGKTIVVHDVCADPLTIGYEAAYASIWTSAFVHAPIVHEGELVAFLDAHSDEPRNWTEEEIRLIQEAASRLWEFVQRSDAEEALQKANAQLQTLAATDFLTGMWNNRTFDGRLREEWEEARRMGRHLSMALIDLDDFKGFNDAFGHPAGDEALRTVADVLRKETRAYDVAARLGGEEFALLMPSTGGEEARQVAERVRKAVAASPWKLRPITASVGVATLDAQIEDPKSLVQAADRALYTAKRDGRNRVVAADGP